MVYDCELVEPRTNKGVVEGHMTSNKMIDASAYFYTKGGLEILHYMQW
jgi:hypothetical protein